MLQSFEDKMHAAIYRYKQVLATITNECCIASGLGT